MLWFAVVVVVALVVGVGALVSLRPSPSTPTKTLGVTVTFSENGLTPGVRWTIYFDGEIEHSTNSTIAFPESWSGNYTFDANATGYAPVCGAFQLDNTSHTVMVNFTPEMTYPIKFTETGMGVDSGWTAAIGCFALTTWSSTTIVLWEPNGSYGYSVSSLSEQFYCNPCDGRVTVRGSGADVTVAFSWRLEAPVRGIPP
ncbi:MAG TPA: hypothetical protein VEH57_00270 [Thermoplasmata archaeon]|nr:hypothetical protein [Thermoplasmata archaeon]